MTSRMVTSLEYSNGQEWCFGYRLPKYFGYVMNHFSQLLNVHGVSDVRQRETHTAEPLVPEPSAFEVELAIDKLKSHKSPGADLIPTELINAEE